MLNKMVCLLILMAPVFAFCQSYPSADSANKKIMNGGECDDKIFTRIEILPSIKISNKAFMDSISTYFKTYGISFEDETIRLAFIVDCHSNIRNFQKVSGIVSNISSLEKAILKSSSLWLPGRQNNYIRTSYVMVEMKFKNDILSEIKISQ